MTTPAENRAGEAGPTDRSRHAPGHPRAVGSVPGRSAILDTGAGTGPSEAGGLRSAPDRPEGD